MRVHTRVHTHGVGGGRGSRRSAPCQAPGPPAALSGSGQRECKGLSFQNTSFNTAKGTRMPRAAASEGSWGGWGGSMGGKGGVATAAASCRERREAPAPSAPLVVAQVRVRLRSRPPWAAPERPGRPPAVRPSGAEPQVTPRQCAQELTGPGSARAVECWACSRGAAAAGSRGVSSGQGRGGPGTGWERAARCACVFQLFWRTRSPESHAASNITGVVT